MVCCALIYAACESSTDATTPPGGDAGAAGEAAAAGGSDNPASAGSHSGGAMASAGQTNEAGGADSSAGLGGASENQAGAAGSDTGTSSGLGTSAIAECKTGGGEAYCKDATKPHYWECPEETKDTPPADGCSKADTDIAARWCCPQPFCSSYGGGDQLCGGLYESQPHGYICTPGAPGSSKCQQPNPIATPQLYCCE